MAHRTTSMLRPWCLCSIATLALAAHAEAQVEQTRLLGASDFDRFGNSMAVLPDLDGDGIPELLVSAVYDDSAFDTSGRVEVRSAAGPTVIRTHDGIGPVELLGWAVAATGDLDQDGISDYLISAPWRDSGALFEAGAVDAYSGATGLLLWSAAGLAHGGYFGAELAALHDLDGDLRPETAVIDGFGTVVVLDGFGNQRHVLALGGALPTEVAAIHDVDGDGIRDIAVGDNYFSGIVGNEGRILLYSGASGAAIGSFDGLKKNDAIGYSILSVPDVDGDGIDEIAVSGRFFGPNAVITQGMVQLRSGATFSAIWTRYGISGDYFGFRLALLDDWNLDGAADLAVTSWFGGADAIGSVSIVATTGGRRLHEFEGIIEGSTCEYEFGVATAGADWTGDGIGDLAIGIPSYFDSGTPDFRGVVRTFAGCPAFSASYGAGWPGTLLTPTLAVAGVPALGADITLTTDNSRGVATQGLLLVGFAAASNLLPSGATLLVDQPIGQPITVDASGWSLVDTIPDDPALCFLDVYLQVVEYDPGAVGRLSFSQGLQLRIGFDL